MTPSCTGAKLSGRPRGVCRAIAGDGGQAGESCPTIIGIVGRGPDIAIQDESGRNRNERQEHDRKTRSYEETTGNPYHLSRAARMLVGVLAVIVVITLTTLFLSGAIHW
jgi:hypothetical protein